MGDEIQDPRRTLPVRSRVGRFASPARLYVGATLTLLIAVGKNVNVLQGIVQAVTHMAGRVGIAWITVPFALMLSLSIAGIGSAWMGGSAGAHPLRGAGLDSCHAVVAGQSAASALHHVPYAALIVQAIVFRRAGYFELYASAQGEGAFSETLL